MANTTGSINTVIVTRDEIIKDALQDLRVLRDGAAPSSGDTTDATRKLNMMIKMWATKGALLWCRDQIQVPMQANKQSYTIGPSGADVTSYRPLRVLEGSFIRYTVNAVPYDTPLRLISRLEYEQLSGKLSSGVPNSIYYQPTMGSSAAYNPQNAAGTLYIYVTASDTSRTIFLEVQRPIQDITGANDAFDIPVEWYLALTKNLAAQVADKYEVPEDRISRIKGEALKALEEIVDWGATEEAPVRFVPDPTMRYAWR